MSIAGLLLQIMNWDWNWISWSPVTCLSQPDLGLSCSSHSFQLSSFHSSVDLNLCNDLLLSTARSILDYIFQNESVAWHFDGLKRRRVFRVGIPHHLFDHEEATNTVAEKIWRLFTIQSLICKCHLCDAVAQATYNNYFNNIIFLITYCYFNLISFTLSDQSISFFTTVKDNEKSTERWILIFITF